MTSEVEARMVSRRRMVSLLGLAALGFAVPLTNAEAQTTGTPSTTGTTTSTTGTAGMQRRQERRGGRVERRYERRGGTPAATPTAQTPTAQTPPAQK